MSDEPTTIWEVVVVFEVQNIRKKRYFAKPDGDDIGRFLCNFLPTEHIISVEVHQYQANITPIKNGGIMADESNHTKFVVPDQSHTDQNGGIMTDENDYTKTVGFGYDRSEIKPDDCDLLNFITAGYLAGYLRAKGDSGKVQFTWHDRDNYVFYLDEHPMGVKDLFALRLVLPEKLRNHVRLYKIATRMVPEVVAMAIGDIEMGEMKE